MVYRSTVIPKNDEINEAHSSAVAAFKKKNGRFPTSKDPEFWQMSETYKDSYQKIIDEYNGEAIKLRKIEEKQNENPVFGKSKIVTERICAHKDCGEIVQPTGKRGRPPTKCLEHRAKSKPKVKYEYVDAEPEDEG